MFFFSWFWIAGNGDLCFDRSSEASNVEREKLAEQPVAGQGEGGMKKMTLEASRTVIARAEKTEGWKAGEGGPRGRGNSAWLINGHTAFKCSGRCNFRIVNVSYRLF